MLSGGKRPIAIEVGDELSLKPLFHTQSRQTTYAKKLGRSVGQSFVCL